MCPESRAAIKLQHTPTFMSNCGNYSHIWIYSPQSLLFLLQVIIKGRILIKIFAKMLKIEVQLGVAQNLFTSNLVWEKDK